jgi:hypothetical protein
MKMKEEIDEQAPVDIMLVYTTKSGKQLRVLSRVVYDAILARNGPEIILRDLHKVAHEMAAEGSEDKAGVV